MNAQARRLSSIFCVEMELPTDERKSNKEASG